jgi:hypothetical protein
MTDTHFQVANRVFRAIKHRLHHHMQEFTHCSECERAINPMTSRCPTCGQANPARVSASFGLCLTVGMVMLTLTVCLLTVAL